MNKNNFDIIVDFNGKARNAIILMTENTQISADGVTHWQLILENSHDAILNYSEVNGRYFEDNRDPMLKTSFDDIINSKNRINKK